MYPQQWRALPFQGRECSVLVEEHKPDDQTVEHAASLSFPCVGDAVQLTGTIWAERIGGGVIAYWHRVRGSKVRPLADAGNMTLGDPTTV